MTDEFPSFAKLKENLASEDLPTLREAGLLDSQAIRYLEGYKQHYEPNSGTHYETGEPAYWYYNTETWVRIVRNKVGEALSKAVQSGNKAVVSHAVGLEKEGTAAMDFLDYEKLADLIEEPSLLLLLFGDTGSGKSFTKTRLGELWAYRVGGTVLTNVQSLAEANDELVYVDNYVDLLLYCVQNPKERKLFLADELSSLMSGYGDDRQDVERYMRPFTRKMRKEPFRMSIIGVGHRVGDIHPTLRNGEMAYFGMKKGANKKQAQKHMTIYKDEDLSDVHCEVEGIGLPNWDIDTDDDGVWYWGSEDEILEAARAIEQEGYGDILRLIENLTEDEDEEEEDEWHDCQAETNAGESCPNKAKFPSEDPVVCANHRSKMDDFLSK